MLKTILNYHDWLDWVANVTKTIQDNYVTDYRGLIYAKNETKLWWLIESCPVYEENQTV